MKMASKYTLEMEKQLKQNAKLRQFFHFALFLNMGDNTENLQYLFTAMVQEREINCY